jgi:hypothetical protein
MLGLQQSTERPGCWTVHIWQRTTLTRTEIVATSEKDALELVDASGRRGANIQLPIFVQSVKQLHQVPVAPVDMLHAAECSIKEQLQRRFAGAQRIIRAVCASDSQLSFASGRPGPLQLVQWHSAMMLQSGC